MKKIIVYSFLILFGIHKIIAQEITIDLQSNKNEYICGEPVLLKTKITNPSKENIEGKWHGYSWSRDSGFTIFIAHGGEDYENILSHKALINLNIQIPPLQEDFFIDRHWLPRNLMSGQISERMDILIFPKPGKYKLKAVIQEKNDKRFESESIEINLLNIDDKKDSLSQLGDQNFIVNLGRSISSAHYTGKFLGYPPKEFELAAPLFKKDFKDSVFREYIIYADILTHYNKSASTQELIEGRKESALLFEKEYPNSWLLPDLYRKLFDTYIAENNIEKAEEYLNKAIEKVPNATVLRYVRKNGPDMISEIKQQSGNTTVDQAQPTTPPKKPIGIGLPIAGAAGAVIVLAGLFLFLRKKKPNKAE